MIQGDTPPTAAEAIARYEAIQPRLPQASFPQASIHRTHLEELCDEIDCFVLDGFGRPLDSKGPTTCADKISVYHWDKGALGASFLFDLI